MLFAEIEIRQGVYKGISASEMATSDQRSRNHKLYCPLCKQPVSFIPGDIQSPHFRHRRGSPIAQECEFYSSNYSTYDGLTSAYNKEKSGIPFYIEKIGNKFQLSLGLPPISSNDLLSVKNTEQSIEIRNLNSAVLAIIHSSDLCENQITFVPLEWICREYVLSYSEEDGVLKNIWGNKTLGIPNDGAFFHINEQYSKQICFNGKIYSDTEYYFVTSTKNRPEQPFIKIIEEHPLITTTVQKWVVYKLSITELTSVSCEFAENHRVRLVEPPTEYIPVWPPLIQDGNRYTTNKMGLIYCGLQAHNQLSTHEIGIYDVLDNLTEVAKVGRHSPLFTTSCNDGKITISSKIIDEYDKKIVIEYSPMSKNQTYKCPNIQLLWNGEEVDDEVEIIPRTNKDKLSFKSDIQCDIYHLHGLKTRVIYWNKDHISSIAYIEVGDIIQVLHGLDRMCTICFKKFRSKNFILSKEGISDEEMYNILTKSGSGYIPIPSQLKYIASKIVNYPKSSEFMRTTMKKGEISKKAAEYLLKKYVLCDY
ncbi:MAG: hypothetical protein PHQ11_06525 [Paludibacter sp.]|nr:hypothetical protein [Paludibacter sp.]